MSGSASREGQIRAVSSFGAEGSSSYRRSDDRGDMWKGQAR